MARELLLYNLCHGELRVQRKELSDGQGDFNDEKKHEKTDNGRTYRADYYR